MAADMKELYSGREGAATDKPGSNSIFKPLPQERALPSCTDGCLKTPELRLKRVDDPEKNGHFTIHLCMHYVRTTNYTKAMPASFPCARPLSIA